METGRKYCVRKTCTDTPCDQVTSSNDSHPLISLSAPTTLTAVLNSCLPPNMEHIEVGNIHVTVFTPWNYRRPHPNCRISPSIAQTFTCVLMWKLVVNIAVGNLVTSLLYDEITVLLLGTCSAFYPQSKVKLHLVTFIYDKLYGGKYANLFSTGVYTNTERQL